jgi:hypothetical protein
MYKELFLPLAKYLVKTKGLCNISAIDLKIKNCSMCYYKKIRKPGTPCMINEAYAFALKFIEENENKQLEFEF